MMSSLFMLNMAKPSKHSIGLVCLPGSLSQCTDMAYSRVK